MLGPAGSRVRSALLSQASRRRWCGPRIGGSGRTSKAADLAEAAHPLPSPCDASSARHYHAAALFRTSSSTPLPASSTKAPTAATSSLHGPFALGGRQQHRFLSSKPEPEIPGFFESLWASASSADGQMFLFGVLGLTGAAMLGDRMLTETHGETHGHKHGSGVEHSPAHGKAAAPEPIPEPAAPAPAEEAVTVDVSETVVVTPEDVASAEDPASDLVQEVEVVEPSAAGTEKTPTLMVEEAVVAAVGDGEGEESKEPEDCPFCKFMRAGPCGSQFTAWEDCVDSAEKDKESMVEKCMEATHALKVCMEANEEYYGVILEAEKSLLEREQQEEPKGEGEEGAAEGSSPEQGAPTTPEAQDAAVQASAKVEVAPPESAPASTE